MGCVPIVKAASVTRAWPEPFRLMVARFETPSRYVTCGGLKGVPLAELTVAVRPTGCPKTEGFALELTVQFDPAGQSVWIFRLQLVMVPTSAAASSITYKLQVPFGSIPLKLEAKVAVPKGCGCGYGGGGGAGEPVAGKLSVKGPTAVGLYIFAAKLAEGTTVAPISSSVKVTLLSPGFPPPVSAIITILRWPPGLTSSIPTSCGNV